MAKLEWRLHQKIKGLDAVEADSSKLSESLATIRTHNQIVRLRVYFWRCRQHFLRGEQVEAVGLVLKGSGTAAAGIRLKWRADLDPSWTDTPILYLDGTLNDRLARVWLPRLQVVESIKVELLHATGVQRRQSQCELRILRRVVE